MKNTLPLSSFPWQAFLAFESYYQPLLSLVLALLLLFKCYVLPYTSGMSAQEVIIQIVFFLLMTSRISVGSSANKTENSDKVLIFALLDAICIFGCTYFIFLQNFVLLIEVILVAISLLVTICQLVLAVACFWVFKNYEKQH